MSEAKQMVPAKPLIVERAERVMTLTINAPETRNSLSAPGVREAMAAALQEFAASVDLHVLIITGTGGAFSSGGDLNRLKDINAIESRASQERSNWSIRQIVLGEKPVIAAVEGAAFGAGLGLAAAADLVIAAEGARFCSAFVRIGAIPDYGLFWSLPFRVGPAKARQMMMLGEEIDAAEALRLGLADKLVAKGEALAEARKIAQRLASGPPLAIRRIKSLTRYAPMDFERALQVQLDNAPQIFSSEDFHEGARAFLEKRKPVFRGR
ncbi:MAG TPA: enoyl-CoA hydratase-related protein [Stellaceae bacterium]|nr:enoyl-CoA hydratase-related protein [Stellaceae bacterium]